MHHTVAYRVSAADATETDMTPVPDGIMSIVNTHFMPQQNRPIIYATFQAATPTRAKIVTPSFRQVTTPWIRPQQPSIVPGDEANVADYSQNPLMARALEEISILGTQTSGGTAVEVALLALARGPLQPAPRGDIYTLRGTGAVTLVAGAWGIVTPTWQDSLPAGRYSVVGLEYIGTTALSARIIFDEQTDRPGCVGGGTVSNNVWQGNRKGYLGEWGQFDSNRMPTLECLANAADTAQEFYMDIIKIR